MIHTNGLEPYVALLKATSWNQSRAKFEKAFERAMGMTLDDTIANYETARSWWHCDDRSKQYRFHACAQPGLVLPPGGETYFDLDISCTDPEVAGPTTQISPDSTSRIWRDITNYFTSLNQIFEFDAPVGGDPSTVLVEIRPCTTDCLTMQNSTRRWNPGPDGDGFFTSVIPGRSVMRISRAADDPGPVRFRWYQPGP